MLPEHVQDGAGRLPHRLHVLPDKDVAALADRREMLLGTDLLLVDAEAAHRLLMLSRPQVPGHLLERRFQAEPVALFQAGLHVVREPVQQAPVLLGKAVQDPVHALLHQRGLVQLHLVGGKLPDLAGEGPERLLEELVDGGDGEGRIVMQDGPELSLRPLAEFLGRPEEGRDKVVVIRRFLRIYGQHLQFLEDALLHLVRSLVRKGHGQDVAVGLRVLLGEEQADVFAGQVVGFSRPGGGFEDLDHRPQIILKSQ